MNVLSMNLSFSIYRIEMCESNDIERIMNLWQNEGWGYANAEYDNDGLILEAYLYLGQYNTYTHIHISWSRRYSQYDYVVTCNRDHSDPVYMSCYRRSHMAYVQEFAQLLQECPGAGGGSRKKSRKSIKTRKSRKTRKHVPKP